MNETILVGLMSLAGTLFGSLGGIVASNKLTAFRLQQLEDKVNKHNNVIERVYELEGRMNEVQHDIRDLKGAR